MRTVWVLGLLFRHCDLSAVFVFSDSWMPVFIKGTGWRQAGLGVSSKLRETSFNPCIFLPRLSVHQECSLASLTSSHHLSAPLAVMLM